jgi:peptide/nickel transport system permease protein
LLHALLVTILVSITVFMLIRMLPSDPVELLYAENALAEMTEEDLNAIRHELWLDRPIIVQYLRWAGQVITGNFGKSIMRGFDIGAQIASRMSVTVTIGASAFIVGLIVGPLLGIVSAVRRGKLIDNFVSVLANIGVTAPQFWIAILLVFVFGLKLKLLPTFGYTPPWENFGKSVRESILPVFVSSLGSIAATARQMRSSALETLGEDFIRTAWAKGMNERKVIFRHMLKNSLIPVITLQGSMLRSIFGGSVIVETIFVIPGMGKMMVDGLLSQDYPVVQATALLMTMIVVLSTLVVDLAYGWIDPRIQYS